MSTGQRDISMNTGTLFGHPTGLFTLFFAEMWERFSYYGMRALLLFYMLKGFLGYGDSNAYAVYGAYTALVYMTPFFGGMIADKLLGSRRAVILGGLLMAAGHLMMTIESTFGFFTALALLIVGNGFFKPNISTIVGTLYPEGSPKRDGGFTIFYIGINLGAAMSPLLCAYVGETYGWHYGFGLATIGMITGVAVFVAPSIIAQLSMFAIAILAALNIFWFQPQLAGDTMNANLVNLGMLLMLALAGIISFMQLNRGTSEESLLSTFLARIIILAGAVAAAVGLVWEQVRSAYNVLNEGGTTSAAMNAALGSIDNYLAFGINVVVAVALVTAAIVTWIALGRGGLPKEAGEAPDKSLLHRRVIGPITAEWTTYLAALLCVPVLVLLVSGVGPLFRGEALVIVPDSVIQNMNKSGGMLSIAATALTEISKLAGLILIISGIGALAYLVGKTFQMSKIPRERMFVVLILTFFSLLFWAFFEQAGSSLNNFADRNVDRVVDSGTVVTKAEVNQGKTITFRVAPQTDDPKLMELPLLGQEQLGYKYGNDDVTKQIAHAIRVKEEGKDEPTKSEDIDNLVTAATKGNYFTMTGLTYLREMAKSETAQESDSTVTWQVTEGNEGMVVGGSETPASVYQAVNPIYILIFGIVFSVLWTLLASIKLEPSTPVKFSLGLMQLGLGFVAIWYGAQTADERGMVALGWLFLGYLLHTTGELCLSPVGLSMVTKLSPKYLVSTVMGMWFLATAFSQLLAGIIAQFTGVSHGGGGGIATVPIPSETVGVYGGVFFTVGMTAIGSGVVCLILSPLLSYWMHTGVKVEEEGAIPPLGGRVVADGEASEHIQPARDQIRPDQERDTNIQEE